MQEKKGDMKNFIHTTMSTALIGVFALTPIRAQVNLSKPYVYKPADRQQAKVESGLQIMPATFLREFDPITLLYDRDMASGPGPLDKPEPFLSLKPSHPGEYRWLDPRTLEFRPAAPWKPMQTYTVKASGQTRQLTSLLAPPIAVYPSPGSMGLEPFDRIEITFPQPVNTSVLNKLVTFEAVKLPGIEVGNAKIYGSSDYRIKTLEQTSGTAAKYAFLFARPFPYGMRIRTVVRLASDPTLSDARRIYHADTRRDFTMDRAGTYESPFTLNAAGAAYGRDQAVRLSQDGILFFDFSSEPASLTLTQVKSMLNFSPAPRRMDWSVSGTRLTVRLAVDQERLYQVVIAPTDILDASGRKLKMDKPSSFFVYQPIDKTYARWGLGRGMVERRGPQHFPLLVNGVKSLDLRVHKIDPRHKAFWPYPSSPVRVDENQSPPGPGEEPAEESSVLWPLSAYETANHLRMLGSPHYSAVLDLDAEGVSRFKSVDLKPILAKVSGPEKPGTYLIGFRTLDGATERSYIRLQVTDLAASTVESKHEMAVAVTSLSTGRPVSDAEVILESLKENAYVAFHSGRTDGNGMLRISHASLNRGVPGTHNMKRLVIRKDDDVLVLDCRPSEAPPEFANNHWSGGGGAWLNWLTDTPYDLEQDRKQSGFLFTERPIYRPNEPIYFKGMVRTLVDGKILSPDTGARYTVAIYDPSEGKHEFQAKLSALSTFNDSLVEKDLPTGDYRAQLIRTHPKTGNSVLATTSFAVQAYRIPRFEVRLNGPEKAPNDRPVSIRLSASYYAGGKVTGQNVAWSVVSYPFAFRPEGLTGYVLSTDNRYGGVEEEMQQGAITQTDATDDQGQAVLAVNPQGAVGGNPRKYVIEATVTDVDEQTVSQRFSFTALPPFMLGFKAERHVTASTSIKAEVLAIGVNGKLEAGHRVTAQLRKMSWVSYLQETDFSLGKPKYRTQESSELVAEKSLTTGTSPVPLEFTGRDPGVYVLELTARDRLGRVQSVKADIYLAGSKPITWKRSDPNRFETVPDKSSYKPGEEARILLKSPFQKGLALGLVEKPDGNLDYKWIDIADGQGTLLLSVTPEMAPRIPVSFLLMRPRIAPEKRLPEGTTLDVGRPQTSANTTWLKVEQSANILKVGIEHAASARPGTTLDLKVSLKDAVGGARSGEVALWLVDEAVLSLAKEGVLDPLPAFTPEVRTRLSLRDTRNLILGNLRLPENPGGDGEGADNGEQFGKVTVRKNFRTVPYWNPSVQVDKTGSATVKVPLSDDLTNFAVRAVAVSASDRFGTGASRVKVRLPVLIQPALPRFVRPGDNFQAGGVARVVEGEGGPAAYKVEAKGLKAKNESGSLNLDAVKALPIKTNFSVLETGFDAHGRPLIDSVTVEMAVERRSDKASDGFRVRLPLLPDRNLEEHLSYSEVTPSKPMVLPALPNGARAGTLSRHLLVTEGAGLLKAVAAMNMLVGYPHGCTEQRISLILPALLYRDVWARHGIEAPIPDIRSHIASVLNQMAQSQTSDGLFAYWPGGTGELHLTGYAVDFLTEVKRANETSKAGYAFDETMYKQALDALERALRSDYSRFTDGYKYYERSIALAALAYAGRLNVAYARELAMQTNEVDLQSQARILKAMQKNPDALKSEISTLRKRLWDQTVFKMDGGKEVFAGLQQRSFRVGARVHAGEITALASLVSAFGSGPDRPAKLPLVVDELINLGASNGWGSTLANSLALQALRDYLATPTGKGTTSGTFACGPTNQAVEYDAARGSLSLRCAETGKAELKMAPGGKASAWQVRYSQRYLPVAPGSHSPAIQKGFVVKRTFTLVDSKGDRRTAIDSAGMTLAMRPGDILEEHIQVQNPQDRYYVAVTAPFAAGLEYMNPTLETSGEDAKPKGITTNPGSYQSFRDDRLSWYFDRMAPGTYDFHFRLRATVEGEFSHPSARAEMMYEMSTYGTSPGAKIAIKDP